MKNSRPLPPIITRNANGKLMAMINYKQYMDVFNEMTSLQLRAHHAQILSDINAKLTLENQQLRKKLKLTSLKLKDYNTLEYQ